MFVLNVRDSISVVVLHGPPGIGKTEVVRRVAEYTSDRFVINHFAGIFYIPLKARSPQFPLDNC